MHSVMKLPPPLFADYEKTGIYNFYPMSKISLFLRPSARVSGEGVLCFRLSHAGATAVVSTGVRIFSHEWSSRTMAVNPDAAVSSARLQTLQAVASDMQVHLQRLHGVFDTFSRSGSPFHVSQVAQVFRYSLGAAGFVAYAHDLIFRMLHSGSRITAERYRTSLNSFCRFLGHTPDIPFPEFNSALLHSYERWLHLQGVTANTSSFYLRNLRAVFNRAVADGVAAAASPFSQVFTGVSKTVKRAIDIDTLRALKCMPLPQGSYADLARSLFFFSFYTRGMSFVDMAFLRKSDVAGGRLTYCRQKTHRQLSILWEAPMQRIVEGFAASQSPFLLPIISRPDGNLRRQYLSARQSVNRHLRILGERLGLTVPLTMYVARHSWASIARGNHVPVAVISEALGHTSEHTTLIYLASFEPASVDRANRMMLDLL